MEQKEQGALFNRLFAEHLPTLRRVIARTMPASWRNEVDDLVQITRIKCRRTFKPDLIGTFRYWVLIAGKRNAYSRLREQRRMVVSPIRENDVPMFCEETPDPLGQLLAKERRLQIETFIESCGTPTWQKIAKLWFLEDMPYAKIAETTGIAPGTVMSALHRMKRLMRERLTSIGPVV